MIAAGPFLLEGRHLGFTRLRIDPVEHHYSRP
jgi:hypothetical protein